MGVNHHKILLASVFVCVMAAIGSAQDMASGARPNDNVTAAGRTADGVVTVVLVAGFATWQPEGESSPALPVVAFAAEGGPFSVPGPLLRGAEGSTFRVGIRNTLPRALIVHGLVAHTGVDDELLVVPAGETRTREFSAGEAGTYFYWATTTAGARLTTRSGLESQLGGALIVDGASAPRDRVFVMTEWTERPTTRDGVTKRAFAINGRSWPATERMEERVGIEIRWRWVNLTASSHPMHLHGFYFTVDAVGDGIRARPFASDPKPRVVTQFMPVSSTMDMRWTPERPGNWLLHCHIVSHMSPSLRFWAPPSEHGGHAIHDPATAMSGLVMGIRVIGNATDAPASSSGAQRLTLGIHSRPGAAPDETVYAFATAPPGGDTTVDAATVPGPPILLTRGAPVEITICNHLSEATTVHWHGIELESYYDGVPGFGGSGGSVTPAIEPGASLVVRFTPQRSGTFIYHTHSHDDHQLASGLYGAMVVLDPGQTFDVIHDHLLILGMNAPYDPKRPGRLPIVVNGSTAPPLTLKAGERHRLRLVNITALAPLHVSLLKGPEVVEWKAVAKDGADLPSAQQTERPAAMQVIAPGETYDFEVTAADEEPLWLEVRGPNGQWIRQHAMIIEKLATPQ